MSDHTRDARFDQIELRVGQLAGLFDRMREDLKYLLRSSANPLVAVSTYAASVPPTQAQLVSAFGSAASKGAGFTGILDVSGSGVNVYWVISNGTSWYYAALTKPA